MRKQSCAIAVLLVLWGFGLEGVSSDASSSISHHLSPGHIPALRQYKWDATRSRMLGRMKLHLSQVQEGPEKDSSSGVKTRPRSPRFEEERCLSLSCKESPGQESLDVKRDPSGAHLPKPISQIRADRFVALYRESRWSSAGDPARAPTRESKIKAPRQLNGSLQRQPAPSAVAQSIDVLAMSSDCSSPLQKCEEEGISREHGAKDGTSEYASQLECEVEMLKKTVTETGQELRDLYRDLKDETARYEKIVEDLQVREANQEQEIAAAKRDVARLTSELLDLRQTQPSNGPDTARFRCPVPKAEVSHFRGGWQKPSRDRGARVATSIQRGFKGLVLALEVMLALVSLSFINHHQGPSWPSTIDSVRLPADPRRGVEGSGCTGGARARDDCELLNDDAGATLSTTCEGLGEEEDSAETLGQQIRALGPHHLEATEGLVVDGQLRGGITQMHSGHLYTARTKLFLSELDLCAGALSRLFGVSR